MDKFPDLSVRLQTALSNMSISCEKVKEEAYECMTAGCERVAGFVNTSVHAYRDRMEHECSDTTDCKHEADPVAGSGLHKSESSRSSPVCTESPKRPDLRWWVNPSKMPARVVAESVDEMAEREQKPEPKNIEKAFRVSIEVFRTFFSSVSPTEVAKSMFGLGLLSSTYSRDFKFPQTMIDEDEAKEAYRYMKYCSAAYGPVFVNKTMMPETVNRDADWPTTEASFRKYYRKLICHHTDIKEEELLRWSPHSSWLCPAHYVAHIKSRDEVVVVIRGTLSVEDVVTDLSAQNIEFRGTVGHAGMIESAREILVAVKDLIESTGAKRVTCVGHSLGAGTAAYLAMLLEDAIEGEKPIIRGIGFGIPGLLPAEDAAACKIVTSYINGYDMISRLSFGHMLQLRHASIQTCNRVQEWMWGSSKEVVSPYSEKLFPPGRIVLLWRDEEEKELYHAGPTDLSQLQKIPLHNNMFSDHMPPRYEKALKRYIGVRPGTPSTVASAPSLSDSDDEILDGHLES